VATPARLAGLILLASLSTGEIAAQTPMTPFETALNTPRGQLKNPYFDFASVAAKGYKIYLSHDCNGCHGGGGGGGMAAPLTNEIWIYGNDDDTLFRVISLGTGKLSPGSAFQKQGFVRKGSENVVEPMPFGTILKTDVDIWKIVSWIRLVYCERHLSECWVPAASPKR
jgi:mono/diheme cytochrome c family protein